MCNFLLFCRLACAVEADKDTQFCLKVPNIGVLINYIFRKILKNKYIDVCFIFLFCHYHCSIGSIREYRHPHDGSSSRG